MDCVRDPIDGIRHLIVAWCGIVWQGSTARHGTAQHGAARRGAARHGTVMCVHDAAHEKDVLEGYVHGLEQRKGF